MTADALIIELGKRGVEISRRTLFAYRKSDPREVPDFGAVDDWVAFILKRQVYEPGRTQSPEQREAKERRAMSRDGRQQANGDSDAEKYSTAVERRERIIKLRLGNQARRTNDTRFDMAQSGDGARNLQAAWADQQRLIPENRPSRAGKAAAANEGRNVREVIEDLLAQALG